MGRLSPKQKRDEALNAKEVLKRMLEGKSVVFTQLCRVSQDGMNRTIKVLITGENEIQNISALTAKALGWKFSQKHNGVSVGGCGMDMGFHLVYSLSHCLYSEEGERAGYRLSHRWL